MEQHAVRAVRPHKVGSTIARRLMGALSRAHEERQAFHPSRDDDSKAEIMRVAFEGRGYRFRVTSVSWRVARGDTVSASSQSNLEKASQSLMLMEALAAVGRAEWARKGGLLASEAEEPVQQGQRAVDVATGLTGTIEEISGPYATFLSDPLPRSLPAWAWRAMPDASEGDRIRLYSLVRSMALVDSQTEVPVPTWSTVASAVRDGLVPFREDELAPQPGGL